MTSVRPKQTRTKRCVSCQEAVRGKVYTYIPHITTTHKGYNLCADCADKAMELYMSKVRRNAQETASFRGFILFARDRYKMVSPRSKVTYTSLVASLESGSLSVEDLLKVLEQVTRDK
jgi:hypothetical protein